MEGQPGPANPFRRGPFNQSRVGQIVATPGDIADGRERRASRPYAGSHAFRTVSPVGSQPDDLSPYQSIQLLIAMVFNAKPMGASILSQSPPGNIGGLYR